MNPSSTAPLRELLSPERKRHVVEDLEYAVARIAYRDFVPVEITQHLLEEVRAAAANPNELALHAVGERVFHYEDVTNILDRNSRTRIGHPTRAILGFVSA